MSPAEKQEKQARLNSITKHRTLLKSRYGFGACPPELSETFIDVDMILSGKQMELVDELKRVGVAV